MDNHRISRPELMQNVDTFSLELHLSPRLLRQVRIRVVGYRN
jgi:hypothetical protein